MAEVDEELTFCTKADQVTYHTKTNGDKLNIAHLNLNQAQAASLAWLVNAVDNIELEFQVKIKEV